MRPLHSPSTALLCAALAVATTSAQGQSATPNDSQVENLVRRSYQYVAMYNVNNMFALKQGGWNLSDADTQPKDHKTREIARPNNDTLYIGRMLDLRKDPVILEMPAFDSKLKPYWFAPKGKTCLDVLVATSVIGPIGLPAAEAEYPTVTTTDGGPEENRLPIARKDEDLSINLRIYVPDEHRMKTWRAPKAEIVK